MLEFLSPINRYLLDYRLGILLRITGSQIIYGHLYHWSNLGWLDLSLVGLWNCDRGIVHWTKNHCHCGWMSLCLVTLLDPELYTFILIRVSDKASIFRWVIIDWAGCEQAKTDHIYIVLKITNHGLKRSLWPVVISASDMFPNLRWLPLAASDGYHVLLLVLMRGSLLTPEWWPMPRWPMAWPLIG